MRTPRAPFVIALVVVLTVPLAWTLLFPQPGIVRMFSQGGGRLRHSLAGIPTQGGHGGFSAYAHLGGSNPELGSKLDSTLIETEEDALAEADASGGGAVDPERVRRVIQSHKDQIRECYETELPRSPRLAGTVKVRFVINDSGAVTRMGVAESSVHNSPLENCIAARVRRWDFPRPQHGAEAIVSYPFVFKQRTGRY